MFFKKPTTTHMCPMCYKQFSYADGGRLCDFCDSELTLSSFPEPVAEFFQKRTPNHLRAQLVTQDEKIRKAIQEQKKTFYLKDYRNNIQAALKLAKQLGYDE